MLLATVNPAAAAAIGNIKKVGVGSTVVYHALPGYMRDKRTSFPAFVQRQREDGSLDLLVFMEREDFVTQEHVQFRSHNQPHHCWSAVEDVPVPVSDLQKNSEITIPPELDAILAPLNARLEAALKRITVLEMKRPPGRPRNNPPQDEQQAG